MNKLEWAKQYFADDKFATQTTGIEILSAVDGRAVCQLVPDERHFNAAGNVMGGALFTLADFTSAIALHCGNDRIVSLTSNITFLSAAKGDVLTATAECVKSGRSTATVSCNITDAAGRQIASVISTGFKLQNAENRGLNK